MMQVIISIVLLVVGLYVVVAGHGDADLQKWAAGWIGLVLGFWLK
jgi:hypothetical protein